MMDKETLKKLDRTKGRTNKINKVLNKRPERYENS